MCKRVYVYEHTEKNSEQFVQIVIIKVADVRFTLEWLANA